MSDLSFLLDMSSEIRKSQITERLSQFSYLKPPLLGRDAWGQRAVEPPEGQERPLWAAGAPEKAGAGRSTFHKKSPNNQNF